MLLEELIIDLVFIVASFLLGMFGNKETAKKLIARRRKIRAKQEKKVKKDAKRLEEDLEVLKEI